MLWSIYLLFFYFFLAASRVFLSEVMLHTVSPWAGSHLRTVAHIVGLLSKDLTGCGSGAAGNHSSRWSARGVGSYSGAASLLSNCFFATAAILPCSDCAVEADPNDQVSTIQGHDLEKMLLFKAKQLFQNRTLLLVVLEHPGGDALFHSCGPWRWALDALQAAVWSGQLLILNSPLNP